MPPSVTPDLVVAAYRLILGREPENQGVVQACLGYPDVAALRRAFLASPEFASLNPQFSGTTAQVRVPVAAPPLEVDVELDEAPMALMMRHVQKEWTHVIVLRQAGCELLYVREDDAAGPPAGCVSNLFLFRKRAAA